MLCHKHHSRVLRVQSGRSFLFAHCANYLLVLQSTSVLTNRILHFIKEMNLSK